MGGLYSFSSKIFQVKGVRTVCRCDGRVTVWGRVGGDEPPEHFGMVGMAIVVRNRWFVVIEGTMFQ